MDNKINMKGKRLIAKSIFMTHVRRIGIIRTAFGGGLMYVSILEFIFLHLTTIVVLYNWILAPALKLKRYKIRNFIVLDRNRIDRMRMFDRINCLFCGYANGTAHLWNIQLDELASASAKKGNIFAKFIGILYSMLLAVFLICNFIFSKLLFLVISAFLGLHWAKTSEIRNKLNEENYAGNFPFLFKKLIRFAKIYAKSLATNLEQIESAWCPLTHMKREEASYPEHHKNFYQWDKLDDVIEVLAKEGTVSERKPKY